MLRQKMKECSSKGLRGEASYAEYRRQRANASGGRGFRLPLC
jgi:hypothetical protein